MPWDKQESNVECTYAQAVNKVLELKTSSLTTYSPSSTQNEASQPGMNISYDCSVGPKDSKCCVDHAMILKQSKKILLELKLRNVIEKLERLYQEIKNDL
jgi:hypothetical protein